MSSVYLDSILDLVLLNVPIQETRHQEIGLSSFCQFRSNEYPPTSIAGTFLNWGLHGVLCVQILYILFSAEWVLTILLSVAFPEIVLTLNTSSIQYETASLKIFYDAIPILSALIAMVVQFLPYDSTGTLFELAPIMGWLAGGALVDIIIAVAMFILLRKSRRGERERDILLNRLIKHIVGSGIVTASTRMRRSRTAHKFRDP
ncbi:hypothetical protein IEO21_07646 [Rhodonia placenta]|uniref:DUF6534 domain-containing protein n=1 Tax=Rhodonia placenta TaxID=104341 RepID=A0A8H7NXM6_9APHY|nr:hypothetical protein IEO21_07646 [Postia placenta]